MKHLTMIQSKIIILASAVALLTLGGCSNDLDELQQKVAEIKSRPGERIEPLPEIKPYEAFKYSAANMRSPFVPSAPSRSDVATAVRPDVKRAREFLEHKDKVLVNVLFRGRELAHIDEGRKVMNEVLQALDDVAKIEKNPSMEGKRMTAIVAPRV